MDNYVKQFGDKKLEGLRDRLYDEFPLQEADEIYEDLRKQVVENINFIEGKIKNSFF